MELQCLHFGAGEPGGEATPSYCIPLSGRGRATVYTRRTHAPWKLLKSNLRIVRTGDRSTRGTASETTLQHQK